MRATQDTPKSLSVRVAEFLRAGPAARMFHRIPFDKVNWSTSSFLIGTFLMSLTLVPAYIWHFGLDWFQVALFLVMGDFPSRLAITGSTRTLHFKRTGAYASLR